MGIVRIVVIPEELDEKISKYCKKYGLSRSEFLRFCVVETLERKMCGQQREGEP